MDDTSCLPPCTYSHCLEFEVHLVAQTQVQVPFHPLGVIRSLHIHTSHFLHSLVFICRFLFQLDVHLCVI